MINQLLTRGLRHLEFPGKAGIIESTCPKGGNVVTDLFGYHVKLDLTDPVQRKMYCGTYKPDQFAALSKYIRRGMTFVDVGCNLGYFSLMFASFAHDFAGDPGRVYAFDPAPYAAKRLTETIEYNDILNVQFQSVAAGGTNGKAALYIARNPGSHQRCMFQQPDFVPVPVAVTRLDDALNERGVKRVSLLRIDVNGYESEVLNGAAAYLQQGRVDAILCAFDDFWLEKNNSSRSLLYESLAAFGFGSKAACAAVERGARSVLLTHS